MEHCGLTTAEARKRLVQFGPNAMPEPRPISIAVIFLRQFLSPLIYILLAAALVSAVISDLRDAIFISVVLVLNGIVGTVQEYSAGKAAAALRKLEQARALVIRDGVRSKISARDLVPGDTVLLEAGVRVPADLTLVEVGGLLVDESLLTGESEPSRKLALAACADGADRSAHVFAGTMVTRGRATAEVTATGLATEFGKIAEAISGRPSARPPLLVRLEAFSRSLAIAVFLAILVMVGAGLLRGMGLTELFMVSVGLAVSAIPEGLPVAITVALAIGMRRMALRNVIMRNMPAIESLGSCTVIATDKTGTLTMNELTVTDIVLPDGSAVSFERREKDDDGWPVDHDSPDAQLRMGRLLHAAVLPNEASLTRNGDDWLGVGDTVDIALLQAAQRGGLPREDIQASHPLVGRIPYEPDLRYAASFHAAGDGVSVFVKGAAETLVAMAGSMMVNGEERPIDREHLLAQKHAMAGQGLRVLAFAESVVGADTGCEFGPAHLRDLVFLGFAGMKDPLRPEVPAAIAACHAAGITVAMVTGDDPITACAIARDAGLDFAEDQVVTGPQLMAATDAGAASLDALTRKARIYARVEPLQKLCIVESLARNGHVVAVTGDGVNDAPALSSAHVGVSMGRKGTDIARESSDIILTDDNFASIVNGIREGRVAYANIRKVTFMLVATGAAEVLIFLFAVPFGLPMPLIAVQLLWLNLVTNGIQDVALAAEKAEGDELALPPRRPGEPLFDAVMIRRIIYSSLFMAGGAIGMFLWHLNTGTPLAEARNGLLLLFVLFENALTLSARSERNLVLRRGFFSNPLLLASVFSTQALHISAMYIPWLAGTLSMQPVALTEWAILLVPAIGLFTVLECEKWWARRKR